MHKKQDLLVMMDRYIIKQSQQVPLLAAQAVEEEVVGYTEGFC